MKTKMIALLFNAVEDGRIKTISSLLSKKVNVNVTNFKGNTPLHAAVMKNLVDIKVVELLIKAGANVNLENLEAETALSLFMTYNYYKDRETTNRIIKLLVQAGADVNTVRKSSRPKLFSILKFSSLNQTPLHLAADAHDLNLVQFLISHGADVNKKDLYMNSALHNAASSGFSEDLLPLLEVLLKANTEVNMQNSSGQTALHCLVRYHSSIKDQKYESEFFKIIEIFSKHGANFYLRDKYNMTPMDCAVDTANVPIVKAFIFGDAVDINSRFTSINESFGLGGTTGGSFLHGTIDHKLVKFLLKNGANVNSLDDYGTSPLQQVLDAVNDIRKFRSLRSKAYVKKLIYLLKKNPDVNIITTDGAGILTSRNKQFKNLPDYLYQIILEHLAKLDAIGSPISASLYEIISDNPDYASYFSMCQQELEEAKKTTLHLESRISYFNLLTDDKKKLIQYVGNKVLKKNFTKKKLVEKYPKYGVIIHQRFLKAMKNRKIWDRAAKVLSRHLPIAFDPDHHIVWNILQFCNIKDLQNI